jgi:hypothetical protein
MLLLFVLAQPGSCAGLSRLQRKRKMVQSTSTAAAAPQGQLRIAIVFAGAPRSFIFPLVHWSIKKNLIDALDAKVDVFVRTSMEDNVHGSGIGANGVVVPISDVRVAEFKQALKVINPVDVQYVSPAKEIEECESAYPTEPWPAAGFYQALFRKYDKRRYSMFFNRAKSYDMAVAHEKKEGFKYDYVAHARLDALWLSPVEPLARYANITKRPDSPVWLPNGWQEFAPGKCGRGFCAVASTLTDPI